MDSTLAQQWDAPGSPFLPTVGKGTQFLVGFTLLFLGLALTGGFTLSMSRHRSRAVSCIPTGVG